MILSGILIDSIPHSLNFTQTTISEPSAKIILLSGDANLIQYSIVLVDILEMDKEISNSSSKCIGFL